MYVHSARLSWPYGAKKNGCVGKPQGCMGSTELELLDFRVDESGLRVLDLGGDCCCVTVWVDCLSMQYYHVLGYNPSQVCYVEDPSNGRQCAGSVGEPAPLYCMPIGGGIIPIGGIP